MELSHEQKIETSALQKGKAQGLAMAVLVLLRKRGLTPNKEQLATIASCQNLWTLQDWLLQAMETPSVEALLSASHLEEALDAETLAQRIYQEQTGDVEATSDLIFDTLDEWQMAGDFSRCDELLAKIDVKRLTPQSVTSLLTITFTQRQRMTERAAFFQRAKAQLSTTVGEEKAQALLKGLE